jgi:hypothetical protein
VLCNGKTLAFQANDRGSIPLTRSNTYLKGKKLGRVFIEKAMQHTGINRTNLIGVVAYLIRTKQASGQGDAIKKLESGEFDGFDFDELLIASYQVEKPKSEIAVLDEDDGYHD